MTVKNMAIEALEYFEREGLSRYFNAMESISIDAYQAIDPGNTVPYCVDVEDLVRLHRLLRARRALTVLEFGVGYSSVVMADALAKNKAEFGKEFEKKEIRCLHPFHLFCVDAEVEWVELAKERFPKELLGFVDFSVSEVYMGTFHDRFCHYYKNVPNVIPDFIYLDGPAGSQVKGKIDGSDFAENYERTVVSGDLLRLEPTMTPGTMIVVDGRTNNARFLKNNFQREWRIAEDPVYDITSFELMEQPLGIHNLKKLLFQRLSF